MPQPSLVENGTGYRSADLAAIMQLQSSIQRLQQLSATRQLALEQERSAETPQATPTAPGVDVGAIAAAIVKAMEEVRIARSEREDAHTHSDYRPGLRCEERPLRCTTGSSQNLSSMFVIGRRK